MSQEVLEAQSCIETLRAMLASVSNVEAYEVFVREVRESEIRAKNQGLSEFRNERLQEISLRLQSKGNCIVAASTDLTNVGLKELVKKGRSLLRGTQSGPYKRIVASEDTPVEMAYDGSFQVIPYEEKVSRVLNMNSLMMKEAGRYLKDAKSTYFEKEVEEWMWTSGAEKVLSHKSMYGSIASRALHEKTSGSQGFSASELKTQYFDLDWSGVAQAASEGARMIDDAVSPESGRYPVLIDAPVMTQFLKVFAKSLRGDRVLKGTSVFDYEDRGKTLFSPLVSLVDDPERSARAGFRFWDAEGNSTQKQILVNEGKVESFAFDNSAGWEEGIESNHQAIRPYLSAHPRPGFHSLSLVPSGKDHVDLRRELDTGIWIRNLDSLSMLQPGSGEFVGCFSGVFLKNADISHGLTRIIIRGDLKTLFSNIVSIGRDIHWEEHWGAPSVCLSEVDVVGV